MFLLSASELEANLVCNRPLGVRAHAALLRSYSVSGGEVGKLGKSRRDITDLYRTANFRTIERFIFLSPRRHVHLRLLL